MGIAFHLTFNDTILNFVSAAKTDVLDDEDCSGACVEFLVDNSTPGLLVVGMTRNDTPATGVNLLTPQNPYVFMTLEFQPLEEGELSFLSFVDAESQINDPVEPPNDLSKDWIGGTVSVE